MAKHSALGVIGVAIVVTLVCTLAQPASAATATSATARIAPAVGSVATVAAADANLDFESGTTGWTTTGSVLSSTSAAQHGARFATLAADASATITITGLSQGSYSLTWWFKGAPSNNAANLTVGGTGGPSAVALLDATSAAARGSRRRTAMCWSTTASGYHDHGRQCSAERGQSRPDA